MRDDILIIQKKGCVIFTREKDQSDDIEGTHHPNYGVIGILSVGQHLFILIITERTLAAKMPSGDFIYEIKGVDFIPFDKNINEYQNMPVDILKYVEGIKKVLEE